MPRVTLFNLVASLLFLPGTNASIEEPSISPTPPMGFNDWARFMYNINESLFVETADAMVEKGLLAAGVHPMIRFNETLFPNGVKWLSQYLHFKGFHFGIYEDAGNATCGYPGTRGYGSQDAHTFESWGVDYLKFDGCNAGTDNNTNWYTVMDWVPLYGELARHNTDIAVYGLYPAEHYWQSVMTNYGFEVLLKRSQFALWSSFSAPLIISAYVPMLTNDELEFLTNRYVIAIDQDPLTLQATLVSQDVYFAILSKDMVNGDRLLTVLNRGNKPNSTTVSVERVKDLWTGQVQGITVDFTVTLNQHATGIYRISGISGREVPTSMIFNTESPHCMTAYDSTISFTNCTGAEEQVWQMSSQRQVSALSDLKLCLTEGSDDIVALQECQSRNNSQIWAYHVNGNIINSASEECLQEGGKDMGRCGWC
ncbi:MAG: carbohydrate-binding module family 13 protein [Acidomyces sp. 'richmondensis']|nr:MAG: carbohydrate-binding module family 13 protein [Acidomyces sp. 'richmondensis']